MPRYSIANKTFVITGAAGGIGYALAELLAARGAHLALIDRDGARLEASVSALRRHGGRVSCQVVDLALPVAGADMLAQILHEHGAIDGLINNAGVALHGDFTEVSGDDFDWVMTINFRAPVELTRVLLPALLSRPEGVVVNVSSVFGLIAPPGQAAYCASKFALRGFTEALRHELMSTRVRVVAVHPGGIRTDIARHARAGARTSRGGAVRAPALDCAQPGGTDHPRGHRAGPRAGPDRSGCTPLGCAATTPAGTLLANRAAPVGAQGAAATPGLAAAP